MAKAISKSYVVKPVRAAGPSHSESAAVQADASRKREARDLLARFEEHKRRNPNTPLTALQKRMQSGDI